MTTGVATSPDGIPIRFDEDGAGVPAIVFVHGWSCNRTHWAAQMRSFAARHRVVAVDLAGHGKSGAGRSAWTMPAFGADVAAVVADLGLDDVVLVGQSMGGDVVVEAGLLLGDRVRGLVWVDTYSELGDPRTAAELDAFVGQFRSDFKGQVDAFVRDELFLPHSDPVLVERVASGMSSAPPEIALHALHHAVSNDGPILDGLKRLTAPVVAINPDFQPTDEASMRRHGVEPVIMPGVAHFPMLEAPDAFDRVLAGVIAGFGPPPSAR